MTLEERIKAIPGKDGFWKSDTERVFVNTAKMLLTIGCGDERPLTEDEVVDMLENLWYAVSNEYGN